MNNYNNFNKGEYLVKRYLENVGYTVIDVSKDQQYWVQDIDFIVLKGQEKSTIEVKYDSWINSTRNLFIELSSNISSNKPGWIDYCKADYLYYVDAISEIAYVIKLDDIRDYLRNYPYDTKSANDYDYNKNIYKKSLGALINIDCFLLLYDVRLINLKTQISTEDLI